MRRIMGIVACAAAGLGAFALLPSRADACGGFFCSGSVPMDQSGENIVFGVEPDGTVETHVQILYSGSAESFAWILPVPSLPELALGTDALFVGLGAATTPQFPLDYEVEGTCRSRPSCNYPLRCPPPPGAPPPPTVFDASAPAADAGGVTVELQQTVGAFDAVVLTATDAMVLHAWLDEHDYDLPEASIPLLQDYVDLGDYFVALRLHSNRSTGEIQPIVLRYREPEPCIPIRLTAIATVPDLPITAYVLGPSFATPLNYSFIEPPEEPSLWLGSASYASLVGRAVDDAGGRAFVTDFAGDTPTLSLELPSIEHLRDVATPREVVQGLRAAGYMGDAQLLAVLTRAVPPPPGRNPQDYYNCLVSFFPCEPGDESYVADGWTASGAIDVIVESIVAPRERATALLARHPRTTRLFTTMSADEMTVDPVFRLDEGMAAVSHIRRATLVTECTPEHFVEEAPQRIELPSGRTQRVRPGRIDPRDDETICNASGGTLGTPPPPSCGADGGSSAGRDGSTAMDGGAGDPDRIKTSGGCNAAGPGRGGAQPLGGLGFLAVGLAILVSRIRSAMPRRRRPRAGSATSP